MDSFQREASPCRKASRSAATGEWGSSAPWGDSVLICFCQRRMAARSRSGPSSKARCRHAFKAVIPLQAPNQRTGLLRQIEYDLMARPSEYGRKWVRQDGKRSPAPGFGRKGRFRGCAGAFRIRRRFVTDGLGPWVGNPRPGEDQPRHEGDEGEGRVKDPEGQTLTHQLAGGSRGFGRRTRASWNGIHSHNREALVVDDAAFRQEPHQAWRLFLRAVELIGGRSPRPQAMAATGCGFRSRTRAPARHSCILQTPAGRAWIPAQPGWCGLAWTGLDHRNGPTRLVLHGNGNRRFGGWAASQEDEGHGKQRREQGTNGHGEPPRES